MAEPVVAAEVVTPLTLDEAVEITDSIRESVTDLEAMVVRAYFGRVWEAMDYESWDDYVQGEFKRAPLALPREDRRVQVASLRQQGLSQPAIAAVTGVSQPTVHNDINLSRSDKSPDSIVGLDGKERPAKRPDREPTAPPQEVEDTTPPQDESCPYCGQTLPATFQHKG